MPVALRVRPRRLAVNRYESDTFHYAQGENFYKRYQGDDAGNPQY